MKSAITTTLLTAMLCWTLVLQKTEDDPVKKLGALLGKWQTEATLGNGDKVTSELECRWSPQGRYLVCEQRVKLPSAQHRQLTIYSYNYVNGSYAYSTFPDTGMQPRGGTLEIKDAIWTYSSSFENDGKTTQVRVTNDFSTPGTELFKSEVSNDKGEHWITVLQGTAHKVSD